jgi:predicted TPR repeat methyltransferase
LHQLRGFALAVLLGLEGDADAAVRALQKAVGQPGASADVYFFLGEALGASKAKDKVGAQEAYRRYLELAPGGAYRQRAQRMLGAAR